MRTNLRVWPIILLAACCTAVGQNVLESSFEDGKGDAPDGWKLSDTFGKWEQEGRTGAKSLSLIGDGQRANGWVFQPAPLEPNRAYRFSVWYRTEETGDNTHGVVVTTIASVDKIYKHSPNWTHVEFTFVTPVIMDQRGVRLGQWRFHGKVWYDDCTITPVNFSYFEKDGIVLGRDERIENKTYIFQPDFLAPLTNCFRVEQEHTRQFHDDKWWFHSGQYQIQRYQIGGYKQRSAEVSFKLTYKDPNIEIHETKVEASADGKTWKDIKSCRDLGDYRIDVPSDLFPADAIYVRISGQGSMQMRAYRYSAPLDGSPPDMKGATEAVVGDSVAVDNGRLRLVFEKGGQRLVSIGRQGEHIGGIEFSLAQFEKKGIGYKGTGIGVAEATAVSAVEIKVREPQRCVVHVKTARAESLEAGRKFEATYEFAVYAGQEWFASRLLAVTNTDKTAWELRGYSLRVQPWNVDGVRPVSFPLASVAAWMWRGRFMGATVQGQDDFTLAFRLVDGAPHGDATREGAVKINPGQTWTAMESAVIIFVGDGDEPRDTVQKARQMQRIAQSPDQHAEGSIVVQERKQNVAPLPKK
ncbi:MAG: hypothetical protein AB1696_13745 [Planctomycetota bacterium]